MATTVWDNERWTPRPNLTEDITADACIIGLGGAGLAAARELATHGADVVGVDAGSIGGGAAGCNAGFLLAGLADFFHATVARFGGQLASAIHRHTLTEVRRLAGEFPDDVSLTGSLRIAEGADENGDCDARER
jgi:gamma-glutamylputrescine oxidase